MAVLSGTKHIKDTSGRTMKTAGGSRKIRCRKCWNMAIRKSDGKGGYYYQCLGCNSLTISTSI